MKSKRPNATARASVALGMLAFNAEKTLGKCLDSVRPWVSFIAVGVDERTSDKTAKIARQHGADLVFPVKVSDWHECKAHGRVLAQHFGDARNVVFSRLPKDKVDWLFWMDSDDVLVGGERLKSTLEHVPPEVNCCWAEYRYATVNEGKGVTTSFDRERFLRTTCDWAWTHRVHETVAPVGQLIRPIRLGGLHVWHQEGAHKSESSALRNHLLLEIELEEDPNNSRSVFYMANGLFAQKRWAEAAEWYGRTGQHPNANPYERWQAYCYMSLALEQMGDPDGATQAAWMAIDALPQYKEPYYRLAALALLVGDPAKCIYWTEVADGKEEPPYFVFKNPMEYTYNSRAALADAFYHQGEVHKALTAAQAAYAVAPSETVATAIAHYKELIRGWEQANAFVGMASMLEDAEVERLYGLLPLGVRQFGRVRDCAIPVLMRLRDSRLLPVPIPEHNGTSNGNVQGVGQNGVDTHALVAAS